MLQNLKKIHDALIVNYECLKSDYDQLAERLKEMENDKRRPSQEDLELEEQMDMVVQVCRLGMHMTTCTLQHKTYLCITGLEFYFI